MTKPSGNDKGAQGRTSATRTARLILRFMGGQYRVFALAAVMLIFEAATAVMIPLLIAFVVTYLTARLAQLNGSPVLPPATPLASIGLPTIVNPDVDTIGVITAGIVLLSMVNSMGDSMAEIYLAQGGHRLGYSLRIALYAHLQKLSLAFHDQRRTGDVLASITGDVAAVEDFIVSSFSDLVGSILLIGLIMAAIIANSWQVALVAAVIIPAMVLLSNRYWDRIKAASKRWRTSEGELTTATQEMLASIRVIQTYGLGSQEQALFNERSQKSMNAALEAANLEAQFTWIVSVLGALSTAAVIWMAVWLIFRSPLTATGVGLLTAYVKYIQDMFKPTKRIIQEWNTFGKLSVRVGRIGDLLDLKPDVQDEPGAIVAPRFRGHVEFRNVSFTYKPVSAGEDEGDLAPRSALQNISFSVEPGQIVAVVGHTGAGKSTVVQLVPRLYDPTEGQVLIDGEDIRSYTLDSLRAQISMVLQETILFRGSVVENIAYGRPNATGAEIVAAARQANADEFIARLPEGYYTMLGERGSNLSGGQRQRIAIARGFVRSTPILILDEPTTGLDAESSELVLSALRTLMKGKTTIIISHDLNLIRDADQIIVIKAGQIEQMGTHQELLRAGGLYANLYYKQSGQARPSAAPEVSEPAALPATEDVQLGAAGDWAGELVAHPAMRTGLPALDLALNGEAMRDRLQAAFWDHHGNGRRIARCAAEQAFLLASDECVVQYSMWAEDGADSPPLAFPVIARLFPTTSACETYMSQHLAPLVAQVRGRPELALFSNPASILPDLNMVASVFPVDGALPALIGATDRARLCPMLAETLPEALAGSFTVDGLRYEMLHYAGSRGCRLSYAITGRQTDNGQPQVRTVLGEVDAEGRPGVAVSVSAALSEHIHRHADAEFLRIPYALAYLPDLRLLLTDAPDSGRTVKDLIVERLGAATSLEDALPSVEGAVRACAQFAAVLHGSGITLGPHRTVTGEIEGLQVEFALLQQVLPGMADRLDAWLDDLAACAKMSAPLASCLNQGDLDCSQIGYDGRSYALLDFGHVCQAEPALDLGRFSADLRLGILGCGNPDADLLDLAAGRLPEAFIERYLAARVGAVDELALRSRIAIYENLYLMRLAVHSFQGMNGGAFGHALKLLERRMASLSRQ